VEKSVIYGPVPSRRLGHSLGINNIPPKICSYSCVYCQVGNTIDMQAERQTFYDPEEIAQIAKEKVKQAREKGEPIDYLAFVPDGEPTLDVNLGREIDLLKSLDIKIAVITNASLIWREDVRQALQKVDWVSLKVDTVSKGIWRTMNRPHKSLNLSVILEGMLNFANTFKGEITTESMLIQDINDNDGEIEKIAGFLAQLKPTKAYLAIPIRPPATRTITAASEHALNRAYQIFSKRLSSVEYLIGYEGNAFAFTGNVEDDLLGITSVHPMREEAVIELLKKANTGWGVVEKLISEDSLLEVEYQRKKFYMRKLQ
jgi:wyosine [tRNA(Phe)-imidazoG37] synthetase (radical SAM superfamily)